MVNSSLKNGTTQSLDIFLSRVLNTKLKRKSKSIVITCAQYLLVNGFLLLQENENEVKSGNNSIDTGLVAMVIIGGIYAIITALFAFLHAFWLPPTLKVSEEVELDYGKSNNLPLIDSILEIPLAVKWKGSLWWIVWIFWGFFLAIFVASVVLLLFIPELTAKNSTVVAVAAALLQLYQITGDFSEYWVYTRNAEAVYDDQDEPSSA
mmetsp:Transcript_61578/g.74065  ORF Transcript_61578/g.74065 Transcript_61578/m.74065 type:complete len:207 (+) Transcript_61578:18-638(+)